MVARTPIGHERLIIGIGALVHLQRLLIVIIRAANNLILQALVDPLGLS